MVKKVLSVVIGFGMIAVGVAGIANTFLERKNEAAMQEIAKARENTQTALDQNRKELEQKGKEIEKLAEALHEERRQLEEERRMTEQARRSAEATIREQTRSARRSAQAAVGERTGSAPLPAPLVPEERAEEKRDKSRKERASVAQEPRNSPRDRVARKESNRTMTSGKEKRDFRKDRVARMEQRAGRQAARLLEPVEYFNHYTGELVLAEPFDYRQDWVKVRVRIWKNDRLVEDKVIRYSTTGFRELGKTSA